MVVFQRLNAFIQKDIWRIRINKLPRRKLLLITYLRVAVLAIRQFQSNQSQLNASALSFYILLSIVPMVAMAFGIAKGFGYDQLFATQLVAKFPGQEQSIVQIIGFANNLLKDTQGSIIAGISVAVLFWTVIQVLNNIETSFNEIWGIKKSRSLSRKISDYLSMMLIGPFFIIVSSGATVFLTTQLEWVMKHFSLFGVFNLTGMVLLYLLPYAVIWLFFTFVYIFMPNTKVNFSSALLGGIVAGTIYQLLQIFYIQSQVWVGRMNVIYGSFAAVPLFLIWLQLSLRVLLFGTEISFAHQNLATYEFEQECLNAGYSFKRLLSLHIASTLIKRFEKGEQPLNADQIADILDIPRRLVQGILFELTEVGILAEVKDSTDKQPSYLPSQDINHLTIFFVSELLEKKGSTDIPVAQTSQLKKLQDALHAFEEMVKNSHENILLKDI